MTTKTDLLEMIRNGENSGVEFKQDIVSVEGLAKELVAFSNFEGGVVILGVADDGSISGITRARIEEWVMTVCRDKIRPAIIPFFEIIKDIEPGLDVAVVRVTRGATVHGRWHNNRNEYYIRVGSQSREPSPDELGRLFQQRRLLRAELSPVSGATIDDLDKRRLKDYFIRVRQEDVPDDSDMEGWHKLLFNTEFFVEEGATVASILLFGKNPNRFLPQAGIDAVAYLGTEKDYASIENASLRGAMTPLYGNDPDLPVENGLPDQAIAFVQRNTPQVSYIDDNGVRQDKSTYPVDVLREAIVNALVHRDYLLASTNIEISIYSNRIEIISPGRLPNGITPERMIAGTRATRNEQIKDVMRDYNYMDSRGLGVKRKIMKGMFTHNGTTPDLIEADERFSVILWAAS